MPTRSEQGTPTPEVQYLPAMFRRVRGGDIRVPAFQRGFVWTEKQILELLESVYQGFPIGSLLLWRVEDRILKIGTRQETTFPDVEEKYPMTYLLDGMQRLATLYGVLSFDGDKRSRDKFNVVFDLERERFLHYDARELPRMYVRLSDLFVPRRLIDVQAHIARVSGSDELIEMTVGLHSTFQEYLLPMVTITHRDVGKVVRIFERVNSTGTKLSSVDFMRAVTWSEDFDLSEQLGDIRLWLQEINFRIPEEALVKMLGIALGRGPLLDSLLTMRDLPSVALYEGLAKVRGAIEKCVELLAKKMKIFSYDYVPYEGQMLVLARIMLEHQHLSEDQLRAVKSWYWKTSFNEALQGRPDHHIAGLVEGVERILAGGMEVRDRLDQMDFRRRLFTKGKALSTAVASLFAHLGARSIVTGEVIPAQLYMSEFTQQNFERIISSHDLKTVEEGLWSNRVMANVVLFSEEDRLGMPGRQVRERLVELYEQGAEEVLGSQIIPMEAAAALRAGDEREFLVVRARMMMYLAMELMGGRMGGHEGGPLEDGR